MDKGLRSAAAWLLITSLAAITLGCVRKEFRIVPRAPAEFAGTPSTYVDPADVPHPCPPQPGGPQVGRNDGLMNAVAPKIAEWVSMWATVMRGFSAESTWFVARRRWAPIDIRPFERVPESEDDVTLEVLGIKSPDGQRVLEVDTDLTVESAGDSVLVGGEPDSQPSLIDQRTQTEAILAQCGTPCGYHWGAWLSSTSFALGGWQQADDYGQWMQGRLWIYSILDSTASEYQTRIVSGADFERYYVAWRRWVLGRYRALKPTRVKR